jgi:uncharacterized protein (DUF4415 family)
MNRNKPITDKDGEVRSLGKGDIAGMKKIAALPASLQSKLKPRGRPVAEITKERITIRLSPDVVDKFRATGPGWQTRVDAALTDWLKEHSPQDVVA